LYNEYAAERKPLWISCVYPNGRMPGCDLDRKSGDSREGVQKLVEGLLSPGGDASAQVEGIGINCTHPSHLPSLVRDLTREITAYWTSLEAPQRMLTLLLYPDGGKEWDPIARKYKSDGMSIVEWVANVREAVLAADSEYGPRVWNETVVGGCCNTGPEHITLLGDSTMQGNPSSRHRATDDFA
jgi:homocysteine S-methyltransferase